MTGFRSLSEFVAETNPYERELIVRSIDAWHSEQDSGGSPGAAGGGTPPGI
ncbi:hypothetical protein HSTV1_24 [Haloarcula sinaiiensis tailed virus 1]|uniref:Uncharacterized protein n=1 Tax=Haloarcula sinaiiensis tailed virus 1 TaxID=1262530 RepID=R9QT68_9CAUD|nr:hypothetical protein HSTV1_24 [Haloarcula sinaiiensis tailed virus 1]AGC34569.1 hypothetical protein HSTV1_24 [Haloarcula sinaiiensis tailed virus 1]